MMLRLLSLVLVCAMVISGTSAIAQNGVLIDYVGTTRDASAVLGRPVCRVKGFLCPVSASPTLQLPHR
jgi:hypothetical protein